MKILWGQNPFAWWVMACIQLVDALCTLLTFGFWLPMLTEKWAGLRIDKRAEERNENS